MPKGSLKHIQIVSDSFRKYTVTLTREYSLTQHLYTAHDLVQPPLPNLYTLYGAWGQVSATLLTRDWPGDETIQICAEVCAWQQCG